MEARSQRGAILIASLVFLLVMTVVGISALDSNTNQYRLSGNFRASVGALGLAEQGARMSIDDINGPGMPTESLDSLLALPPVRDLTPAGGLERLRTWIDNDDGDSDALADVDGVIVLASIGYDGNAKRHVEIRVQTGPFVSKHAFLSGGFLNIRGDGLFGGGTPNIHANGDVRIDAGSSPTLASLTASGAITGPTGSIASTADGVAGSIVPVVNVADQMAAAGVDYVLDYAGLVFAGGIQVADLSGGGGWNGWSYTGASWEMTGSPTLPDGKYHVQGDAILSGDAGAAGAPWNVTIFSDGNIEVSGAINALEAITSDKGNLFIAEGDISITPPATGDQVLTGVLAAHEQVSIAGAVQISGFIIAENAAASSPLVDTSGIDGDVIFTSHPVPTTFKSRQVSALSWREVI